MHILYFRFNEKVNERGKYSLGSGAYNDSTSFTIYMNFIECYTTGYNLQLIKNSTFK
jgi:hypothetical protein